MVGELTVRNETSLARLEKVQEMSDDDTLAEIAKTDENTRVRLEAVKGIHDEETLTFIAQMIKVLLFA